MESESTKANDDPSTPARSWWGGLAGILTGTTALITALVALLAVLQKMSIFGHSAPAIPPIQQSEAEREDGQDDGTEVVSALEVSAHPSWIVGKWTWKGQSCTDGPRVTFEGEQLVFVTPSTRFVHRVLVGDGDQLRTRVTFPAEHEGETYRFQIATKTMSVLDEATKTRDIWTRCK